MLTAKIDKVTISHARKIVGFGLDLCPYCLPFFMFLILSDAFWEPYFAKKNSGERGHTDTLFPDRYFPMKTYSDEKKKVCEMMLFISPCIPA